MNKLVVTGYMGSGSSAATDLLSEFEGVYCPNGNYEYVFLHCPNGVFDLEDKLLKNNSAIRSDEALRSFRRAMNELYGNKHWWFANYREKLSVSFMDRVDAYIQSLECCDFEGYWYDHEKVNWCRKEWGWIAGKLGFPNAKLMRRFDDRMLVAFPHDTEFYESSRSFVGSVLQELCPPSNFRSVLLDQLLLPHNLYRLPNYFPDGMRVLVVQRDPRDVFILNKYVWRRRRCPVPLPLNVEEFCVYYRAMRDSVAPWDTARVKQIWFEDLVAQYESTVNDIVSFVDDWAGPHVLPKTHFDPNKSCANVAVYESDSAYFKEARYIEKHLSEYLYPRDVATAGCCGDLACAF